MAEALKPLSNTTVASTVGFPLESKSSLLNTPLIFIFFVILSFYVIISKVVVLKFMLVYAISVNIITFLLYGADKYKAVHRRWRIPEAVLMWAAVLGGSVGALAAMYAFRHKTRHKKFTIGVPLILILETALLTLYYGYYY